jgi:hypothetical protein
MNEKLGMIGSGNIISESSWSVGRAPEKKEKKKKKLIKGLTFVSNKNFQKKKKNPPLKNFNKKNPPPSKISYLKTS